MSALSKRVVIVCALLAATACGGEAPETPRETAVENHTQAEKALLQALSEDALWAERARKDELLACLRTVGALRSALSAPVLVAHIDYVPFYGFKNPEEIRLYGHEITDLTGHSVNTAAPFEEWYPAAAALQAIGLPAVPLILDEMRRLEIPPRPPQTAPEVEQAMAAYARQKPQGRADCLARCLVNIYDVGGNGAEMAYLRIQLEAQRATVATKEKANLLKFLDHPAFRPPPAAP